MFVFGKFDVLCFLEIPVLRFALLPYYRRILLNIGVNTVILFRVQKGTFKKSEEHNT